MQSRQETVVDKRGNVIPGATVKVTTLDGTLVQIYADNGVTRIDNPMTTNDEGQVLFHAPNGHYIITTIREGIEVDRIQDVVMFDPDDLIDFNNVDVLMFKASDVNLYTGIAGLRRPPAVANPTSIGELVFELTSDIELVVKVMGSDGVVRSAILTLT